MTNPSAGTRRSVAPLRQAVYDVLVEMIVRRELQPGATWSSTNWRLSGVSRQPVRGHCQPCRARLGGPSPHPGAFVHTPTDAEAISFSPCGPARGGVRQAGRRRATRSVSSTSGSSNAPGEKALADDDQEGSCRCGTRLCMPRCHDVRPQRSGDSSGRSTAGCGGTTCPSPGARQGRLDEHAEIIQAMAAELQAAGELMRQHTGDPRDLPRAKTGDGEGTA